MDALKNMVEREDKNTTCRRASGLSAKQAGPVTLMNVRDSVRSKHSKFAPLYSVNIS